MNKLQEKLNFLLDKYAVTNSAILSDDNKSVLVNGKAYNLLPWRQERRILELKKIVDSKTVENLSHFKIMSINPKTADLTDVIIRELDTAEFISGLKIKEIFKTQNGNTCSIICKAENDAIFTLELSAVLPENAEIIDKHEIITDRGAACDKVIDSQTPLYSVYVYGENKEEYIDVDFELYGLSIYEISVVRQAFDVAKFVELGDTFIKAHKRLTDIVKKAEYSEKSFENVIL